MDKWVTYTGIIETAYLQLLLCLRCCGRTLVAQLLVKLGVFQNLATHYDRNESGLRRKTVPLHRSEMLNQMSVDIKKKRGIISSLFRSTTDCKPSTGRFSVFRKTGIV